MLESMHVVNVTPTREVRETLEARRVHTHSKVMSAFGRVAHDGNPRAMLGVLWHYDKAFERLTVQSTVAPLQASVVGEASAIEPVSLPVVGQTVHLAVLTNVQKTPPSRIPREVHSLLKQEGGKAYRNGLVTVPDEDRPTWALRKLSRLGVEVRQGTLSVGALQTIHLDGRKVMIPAVEISAVVTVLDPALLASAMRNGIGKAKNYGLGLIRISSF